MVNVQQRPDFLRFEAKIDKAGPVPLVLDTRCWLWTGATDARGYGKFWLSGNAVTAQHASLILSGVEVPAGHVAASICGHRRCVRPTHLGVATLRDVHALRHRGRPRIGLGELALIRSVVRDGDATVEYVAWAFRLSPEFVTRIASAG